jgi:hypothetical protein
MAGPFVAVTTDVCFGFQLAASLKNTIRCVTVQSKSRLQRRQKVTANDRYCQTTPFPRLNLTIRQG